MRRCSSAIRAALLVVACLAVPWSHGVAATDDVILHGLSALSQLDAQNYRDLGLMRATDTLPNSSRRTTVANLSCAAAVYVMIERARGHAAAMIDDFYIDPRLHGGRSPGARRPDYVGADLAIDRGLIEAELRAGRPVILRGTGGPLGQHFVLVVGLAQGAPDGRQLIVLDPWPAPGQTTPKPEVRIDFTSASLRHPDIAGLVFDKMRRVGGTPFPLATTTTSSAASAPAAGPDAAGGD